MVSHNTFPLAAIFSLLFAIAAIVAYVIIIMAAWRAMRAHESIAGSLREIASEMTEARLRKSEQDS